MTSQRITYYPTVSPRVIAFSTTRHGGVSSGNYGSFNLGPYSGDESVFITDNIGILAKELGVDSSKIFIPHQIHGTTSYIVETTANKSCATSLEGFDALITTEKNVCVSVTTADCVPILLYSLEAGLSCAIHAGWRGTVRGIVKQTINRIENEYGLKTNSLYAIIGPSISMKAFEVGDEVWQEFEQNGFEMNAISCKMNGKYHIDLWKCNELQLLECGIEEKHIHNPHICTYEHYEDYFSARKLSINSGRILSGIIQK